VARLKGVVEVPNAVRVEPVGEFELKGNQAAPGGLQCGHRLTVQSVKAET
jgi:hypothetical protein